MNGEVIIYEDTPDLLRETEWHETSFWGALFSEQSTSHNVVSVVQGEPLFVFGGMSNRGEDVTDNTVMVTGGSLSHVFGGVSHGGAVLNNRVIVTAGTLSGNVVGGQCTDKEKASENTVLIAGDHVKADVAGGVQMGHITGSAQDNQVRICGGTVEGSVTRGISQSATIEKFVCLFF